MVHRACLVIYIKKPFLICDCYHIFMLEISSPTSTASDSWTLQRLGSVAIVLLFLNQEEHRAKLAKE